MTDDKKGDVYARQRPQPQAHEQAALCSWNLGEFSGTFVVMLIAIIVGGIYGVVRGLGTGMSLGDGERQGLTR